MRDTGPAVRGSAPADFHWEPTRGPRRSMSSPTGGAGAPAARWPGYAAAVWGLVFAAPSFYWAIGGLTGAASTVSPSLVKLAQQRDPGIVAALWVTGALKLAGALLGLALARRRQSGRWPGRVLQFLAWGAGVLLIWHGVLFVGDGLLVQAHVLAMSPDLRAVSRWYTYLWGPWFVLGGLAFVQAARAGRRRTIDRHAATAAIAGGVGAAVLSAGALVVGLG